MKWETVHLGDYCSKIGSGATPKGGSTVYKDIGVSLIRSQNVYNLSFDYNGLAHITNEAAKKLNNVTIEANDVLLNITGDSVARTCIVPENILPARVNQHVSIIRPNEKELNNKFLVYYLASPYMQSYMLNLAIGKGASRNALTKGMIENFPVVLPPLAVQIKIANILSTYDDLIENNQKQIKLLEEAAMRLYKKWFVHLRFPGHETTKIVDGVPEKWTSGKLQDYIEVNPKSISKQYPNESIQYIDISSVNRGRIKQRTGYKLSEAPGRAKRIACDGDTVWGMVRPNLKAYALVLSPEDCDVFSTGFAVLSPVKIPYTFLYCTVTQEAFVSYLVNSTNGSAYPAVKPIHFEEAMVVVPSESLLRKFHDFANPLFRSMYWLDEQIKLLKQARDKLLPKLMNGEIEV